MATTPLPDPPTRANPSDFAEKGDAFMTALPTFQTEMDAQALEVDNNTTEVSNNTAIVVAKEALVNPHYTAIDTVAANNANVTIAADNIVNVNTVAVNVANVVIVADNVADVVVVADNIDNVNTVVVNLTDIVAAGGNITNINAAVANETNINTVAGNVGDVNTVADNIVDVQNAEYNADRAEAAQVAAEAASNATLYSVSIPYIVGDVVYDTLGSSFRCIQDNTGVAVNNEAYWIGLEYKLPLVEYVDRDDLRTTIAEDAALLLVVDLGLFRFATVTDEPDDDETCFVTSGGAWLVECPHWDLIEAMGYGEDQINLERIETIDERIAVVNATSSISSIAAISQASFTVSVTGASVGDIAIACPSNMLSDLLAITSTVTASNTVTVFINNPSASTASNIPTSWVISIIKE